MTPDTSRWADDDAYAYWDDLTLDGLAWEFLRRNGEYQCDFQSGQLDAASWGLRLPIDPAISAGEQSVFWAPALSPNDILLSAVPVPTRATPIFVEPFADRDPAGSFGKIGDGLSELHLSFLSTTPTNGPLCVIIPLDTDLPDRLNALERLWRLLHNHAAPDPHLSEQKRRRLRLMARALDGRAAGASQKEIARCLFGHGRVSDDAWKTSSLRYMTQRLLRDGQDIIGGGYRELLHHPQAEIGE